MNVQAMLIVIKSHLGLYDIFIEKHDFGEKGKEQNTRVLLFY